MINILIDSDKKLGNLLEKISNCKEIGLDTEFIRESTYRPILALIQISLPNDEIYLIDPQEIANKHALGKMFSDSKIIKIIHSAKQDLEAIYSYTKYFPSNIFDTQIASNFLSEKSNIAYSTLVKNICNIDIKEGSWRTNWLKRPLSDDKKEYAANDVKYLVKIKSKLKNQLQDIGRYAWFREEQNNELKISNIIIEPSHAWERINYPLYFDRENLDLLKKIASWRESLAIKYDIPKRWILSDNQIIKILITNPYKTSEIINNIKHKLLESEKKDLHKLLLPKKKIVNKNLLSRKEVEQKCTELLSYVSDEFKIDSTMIANKRDVEIFSHSSTKARFMKGWRYQIFGKLIQ